METSLIYRRGPFFLLSVNRDLPHLPRRPFFPSLGKWRPLSFTAEALFPFIGQSGPLSFTAETLFSFFRSIETPSFTAETLFSFSRSIETPLIYRRDPFCLLPVNGDPPHLPQRPFFPSFGKSRPPSFTARALFFLSR